VLEQTLGALATDLAIDLGTTNTRVAVRGRGIAVEEPSVVAVRKNASGTQVVAVGSEAFDMIGRTPEHIHAVRPIQEGVIGDFELAEVLIKSCIQAALGNRPLLKPRVVVAAPHGVTEVERRAILESVRAAGAREVTIVSKPMAAALGADLPVSESLGNMVVDVGGGTTGIGVLSLGGIVACTSLRIGGTHLDQAIVRWVKEHCEVQIGDRTAEQIKRDVGSSHTAVATVKGRDLRTGIPRDIRVGSEDVQQALAEPLAKIVEGLRSVMERVTPELAADVLEHGLVLCGGSALLGVLQETIRSSTGLPVLLAEDPMRCVVIGAGRLLEDAEVLARVQGA
jgi:rod shape-determining protein MreB